MGRTLAFFWVVPPVPPLLTSTFVVVTVLAALVILIDPGRTVGALVAVLLLQLFAAASGFAGAARRGYYDLLLTRGDRRLYVGLAQWMMSVAAGVASWIVVAGMEWARTGATQRTLAPGTISAFVLVSTIPWATTVALPRFAGAIGWLLVMILTSTVAPSFATARTPMSWPATASAVLLLPETFLGVPFPSGALVAVPSLACAIVSMAVALRWIARADVPLEAAQ